MKACLFLCTLASLALVGNAPNDPMSAPVNDPAIATLVASVSADRLKASEEKLLSFGTRNDFSETLSTPTHGVFGARDWIQAQYEAIAATSGGRMTVTLDTYLQPKTDRTPRAVTESSVIATLHGDEPGPTYVLSSHYDDCNGDCTNGTREAPGMDDNGSAVAAVLEAARILAPHHFRGTIVFTAFDGEELGLWGSKHFADELKATGSDVVANVNNDIIGNSTGGDGQHEPGVVRIFSESLPVDAQRSSVNAEGSENDAPSRELSRYAARVVASYVALEPRQIWRADRFLRGGDQESFQDDGFAAIRFVEAHENFTHQHQDVRVENGVQYGDLLPYIDFAYLRATTQANIALIASLASAPPPPQHAQLVMKKLGYDTTLRWDRSPGATGYTIVYRSTTAANWEHAIPVGDVTTATVPVSKDDFIFGVAAHDAAGHASFASYPQPVREPSH